MTDRHHHISESPLINIPMKMISQVPADYMHLVCLGVMRKLVYLFLKGPLKTRLGPRVVCELSEKHLNLGNYIPFEFARKPRLFKDFERWKATEFRQLLLYTGMVCFEGILPTALYDNFMLLSVGKSILLSEYLYNEYVDYAHNLLLLFVKHVGDIYGREVITYNMHGLLHLSSVSKSFGPLDNVSSFPFENYLKKLKKLVRKPHLPLQQVVRRLSERQIIDRRKQLSYKVKDFPYFKKEHSDGPVPRELKISTQFKELFAKHFCIKITDGDNCFSLNDDKIIVVMNIVKAIDDVCIIYRVFENIENLCIVFECSIVLLFTVRNKKEICSFTF